MEVLNDAYTERNGIFLSYFSEEDRKKIQAIDAKFCDIFFLEEGDREKNCIGGWYNKILDSNTSIQKSVDFFFNRNVNFFKINRIKILKRDKEKNQFIDNFFLKRGFYKNNVFLVLCTAFGGFSDNKCSERCYKRRKEIRIRRKDENPFYFQGRTMKKL